VKSKFADGELALEEIDILVNVGDVMINVEVPEVQDVAEAVIIFEPVVVSLNPE
jgi:hypothetical protein